MIKKLFIGNNGLFIIARDTKESLRLVRNADDFLGDVHVFDGDMYSNLEKYSVMLKRSMKVSTELFYRYLFNKLKYT